MSRRCLLALALLAAPAGARADASASGARLREIARLIDSIPSESAAAVVVELRARTAAGGAHARAARRLLAALDSQDAARRLAERLAPVDPGGLRGRRVEDWESALLARRRAIAALSASPSWSGDQSLSEGVLSAGGRTVPATGLTLDRSLALGRSSFDASLSGALTPGGRVPEAEMDLSLTRPLSPRLRGYVSGYAEHDGLLGIRLATGLEAGVKADIVKTDRQTLTAGAGLGGSYEQDAVGQPYASPTASLSLSYRLRLAARLSITQAFSAERLFTFGSNSGSNDYDSVTSLVWRLSRKWSLSLSHEFVADQEAVPGFPAQRSSTFLSLTLR